MHLYAKRNYKENKGTDYTQKQIGVLKSHVKQKQSNIRLYIKGPYVILGKVKSVTAEAWRSVEKTDYRGTGWGGEVTSRLSNGHCADGYVYITESIYQKPTNPTL